MWDFLLKLSHNANWIDFSLVPDAPDALRSILYRLIFNVNKIQNNNNRFPLLLWQQSGRWRQRVSVGLYDARSRSSQIVNRDFPAFVAIQLHRNRFHWTRNVIHYERSHCSRTDLILVGKMSISFASVRLEKGRTTCHPMALNYTQIDWLQLEHKWITAIPCRRRECAMHEQMTGRTDKSDLKLWQKSKWIPSSNPSISIIFLGRCDSQILFQKWRCTSRRFCNDLATGMHTAQLVHSK